MAWALVAVAVAAGIGLPMIGMAIGRPSRGGRSVQPEGLALRCSICGIDWPPDLAQYRLCPSCLEATHAVVGDGVEPLDSRDARSVRLHLEFERFYAARHQRGAA